jgi:hypothetical protein
LTFNACNQSTHQDEQNQGGFHAGADASYLALSERKYNRQDRFRILLSIAPRIVLHFIAV